MWKVKEKIAAGAEWICPCYLGNNLIGLQLPDDNGEVLYLNPNDPAHQMLLQEAGITMG